MPQCGTTTDENHRAQTVLFLRSHPRSCQRADRGLRRVFNDLGPIFIGASVGLRGRGPLCRFLLILFMNSSG